MKWYTWKKQQGMQSESKEDLSLTVIPKVWNTELRAFSRLSVDTRSQNYFHTTVKILFGFSPYCAGTYSDAYKNNTR